MLRGEAGNDNRWKAAPATIGWKAATATTPMSSAVRRSPASGADLMFDTAGALDVLQFASLSEIELSRRVGDDLLIELVGDATFRIGGHFLAANTIERATDGTNT